MLLFVVVVVVVIVVVVVVLVAVLVAVLVVTVVVVGCVDKALVALPSGPSFFLLFSLIHFELQV